MRRTLDSFQPLLSTPGYYQLAERFKEGEQLYRFMVQAQTSTAAGNNVPYEVVKKIAEVEDIDPLEVTPPLFEVIDPDALERIFATPPTAGRQNVQVTFSYDGYEVTVGPDDVVEVTSA